MVLFCAVVKPARSATATTDLANMLGEMRDARCEMRDLERSWGLWVVIGMRREESQETVN